MVERFYETARARVFGNVREGLMSDVTKQDLVDMEHRMIKIVRGVETTLLTEFQKWAGPADMRARSHAAAMRAFDSELEYLADRVTKLERPAQQ